MPAWKPSSILKVGRIGKTLSDWAAGISLSVQALIGRLDRGWDEKKAVTEPVSEVGGATRGQKLAVELLTPEEVRSLLDVCNDGATGARNRAMIVFGWRAGLRETEVISLMPHHVDLAAQTIRVLHGKGDKARTTGIDADALACLLKWLSIRDSLKTSDKSPLFCTLDGGKVSGRYVRAMMPRLAKRAGIKKRVHFHGLRHAHAAELAAEGVPMNEIQKQLGHSSLAITSGYLDHISVGQVAERIRGRAWAHMPSSIPSSMATIVNSDEGTRLPIPADLVEQIRRWFGNRLAVFHDARKGHEFKAIVLLIDG